MHQYRMLIGGELVEASSGTRRESIDPGSGDVVATYPEADARDAEQAVDAAARAFESGPWRGMDPTARARVMMDLADRIQEKAADIAMVEARDSGGLFRRTVGDVILGARLIRNLARTAQTDFPWTQELPGNGGSFLPSRHYVRREPIGVCVGIVPWNFPFTMGIWKVTMAAVMGNSVILKPASDTPLSALALAEVIAESQVPKGVINIITGPGSSLGKVLCLHPKVDKIAFTGSTEVGAQIMAMASRTIKKVTLELGGKSANIVLAGRRHRLRGRRRDSRFVPALGPGVRIGHAPSLPELAPRPLPREAESAHARDSRRLPARRRKRRWARSSARSSSKRSPATSRSDAKRAPRS